MDFALYWRSATKAERQATIVSLQTAQPTPAADPLSLVRAPHPWGVYASTGINFQYAVFGRDSIETAEDILATHPDAVREIILLLCKLQGTKTDPITEEEPGKIHHEYRSLHIGEDDAPLSSQHIMRELQHKWGKDGAGELAYYGSYDATPLFVRLVERYCKQEGMSILNETVVRSSDGMSLRVRDCLREALGWLDAKITSETLGLFPYKRLNPLGITNQAWKDSDTAYLHLDGTLPDPNAAIASTELQGYAYDAFRAGVRLGIGTYTARWRWRRSAQRLQQQTLKLLWMKDAQYFAQGLDFTDPALPRQIATITSNPAVLLESGLLHDLPPWRSRQYIRPVINTVYSSEMLTDVGIRCRAIKHRGLLAAIDYHGLNAVWPKETYDIAKGLRRAGESELADDLEHRLMQGLEQAGEFFEFFYVSRDGTVWYDRDQALAHFGAEATEHTLVVPETGQAWTIAAAVRIAHEQSHRRTPLRTGLRRPRIPRLPDKLARTLRIPT
jgi:glycogen debranching enzyme